jgi:hypothetical protein
VPFILKNCHNEFIENAFIFSSKIRGEGNEN